MKKKFDKKGNCFSKKERKKFFTKTFLTMTTGWTDKHRMRLLDSLGLLPK